MTEGVLIAGVYKKSDNQMVDVACKDISITQMLNDVYVDVDVPNATDYYIRCFIWNGIDNLIPISKTVDNF